MFANRSCSMGACNSASVTSLADQNLCLNHFLSRSYELLERIDPRGRKREPSACDMAHTRAFIEECSRKALDVSLQAQQITNLERGRLLDILLWAGELFVLHRRLPASFACAKGSTKSLAAQAS
jgi:hypothetical protein